MRYVEIDFAGPGPKRVVRLVECEDALVGPQFIDVTERPEITATSWYDTQSGLFVAPPPAAPIVRAREAVEASRLIAYANPISGSDRYFAEAQRESLLGNAEAAEAAKALGMARFAEIQAANPWPAE